MNLKEIMNKYNIKTQGELASILQVQQSAVSKYLSGKRKVKVEMLQKLAKHLNIAINELLEETPIKKNTIHFPSATSKEELLLLMGFKREDIKNLYFIKYDKKSYLEPEIVQNDTLIISEISTSTALSGYYFIEYNKKEFLCAIHRKKDKFLIKTNFSELLLNPNEFKLLAEVRGIIKTT